jgi:hypothetical protein
MRLTTSKTRQSADKSNIPRMSGNATIPHLRIEDMNVEFKRPERDWVPSLHQAVLCQSFPRDPDGWHSKKGREIVKK